MEKEEQRENSRTRLGFREHDIMQRKEYSMKLKIRKMFPNEIIEEQYDALGHYIDLAFSVHKLGIEKNGHMDTSEAKEKERQKAIEKETGFTIIRINQTKKVLMILLKLAKYKITLLNQPKK